MILLRVTDCKEYPVTTSMDTPFRPLPGMYFFDAWRITPCQAQRIVASDTRSEESPLEQVASEEESLAGVRPSMQKKAAEVAPDQHVYELSRATTRAFHSFDKPLRDRLSAIDKRSMELRPLEHIEVLAGAFASVNRTGLMPKLASTSRQQARGLKASFGSFFWNTTFEILVVHERPCRTQASRCSPSSSVICPCLSLTSLRWDEGC